MVEYEVYRLKCPTCNLENPPTAETCDCGSRLSGRTQQVQVIPSPVPGIGAIRLVWLLPLLGSVVAGAEIFLSWDSAKSAPQQAALAGMVLAWAVIPYCFARAVIGLTGKT
jgi:hypothetical protein